MLNERFLKVENSSQYLTYVLLGFVAAILCLTVSKDWMHYQFLYEVTLKKEWAELLSLFKEPLYFLSIKIAGPIIGFSSLTAISIIFFIFVKLYFLNKLTETPWWISCFFYVCLYLFLLDSTVIRLAFAVGLIYASMYYLKSQNYLVSIILFILATQLHLTTIVFALMYFLYFFRTLNLIVFILFLISPLVLFFDIKFFDILLYLSGLMTDKYQFYTRNEIVLNQNSTGLYFYFIALFYITVSTLYLFLKKEFLQDPFKQAMFSLSALGVMLMSLLHTHVVIGARLGELLLISIVPILSWFYCWLALRQLHWLKYLLILIALFYALARFVYLFPSLLFGY